MMLVALCLEWIDLRRLPSPSTVTDRREAPFYDSIRTQQQLGDLASYRSILCLFWNGN